MSIHQAFAVARECNDLSKKMEVSGCSVSFGVKTRPKEGRYHLASSGCESFRVSASLHRWYHVGLLSPYSATTSMESGTQKHRVEV